MHNNPVSLINFNIAKPLVAPVGIEYLASDLLANGIDPVILDLCFVKDLPAAITEHIHRYNPKVIGISIRNICNQYMQNSISFVDMVKSIIQLIRERTDATVILGGVGYSSAPIDIIRYCDGDLGIVGSGLGLFPDVVKSILSGKFVFNDKSVLNKSSKKYTPYAPCDEYFRFFTPRRDLVDNRRYFIEGGCIGIETKIGCPENCIYCVEPAAKGRKQVFRDPEAVVDEVRQLTYMGITAIHFCDSEFNIPTSHAEDICTSLIKHGLNKKVKWFAYCNPSKKYITRKTVQLFKMSGCDGICFGIDSLDERVLSTLKRKHTYGDVVSITKSCIETGLPFKLDMLAGGPGETEKSLVNSIKKLISLNPTKASVNLGIRIYPNTTLSRMVNKKQKVSSSFLFPKWFISDKLGPHPEELIRRTIGNDKRIIIPSDLYSDKHLMKTSYPLRQLARGKKGVFWNIS